MKLSHGIHLAYCTNIHRGGSWAETFETLQRYTLAVRDHVSKGKPYAIGLRLGADAARELSDPAALKNFRAWLDRENCYVFTINGFPHGNFHGARVKERVYQPDWTTRERLDYTNLLFDLLAQLVPAGVEGSVSTVPVSFKGFQLDARALREARANLWRCVEHIERVSRSSGKNLHLGLEPEPLCTLETTPETVAFFDQLRADRPGDLRLNEHLGVNYDCCHLGVEYESPSESISRLRRAGIKVSKIHLSNALKVHPTAEVRAALRPFVDEVYFHQTIERRPDGELIRYGDLDEALVTSLTEFPQLAVEWRIHFHIPLHARPTALFQNTADHLLGVLDEVKANPRLCSHFEMETYTWEVMPAEMKNRSVVDQLVSEYEWTLARFAERGIARA
ncbi:MAG: metabolite traffic protein EboE [Verrucomicrobia bacterium]|nr:metabolite traffic protein EboE [Verrucomicrobiota bacterium]